MNLRFQELDALRGLAAILVVFFHFTMFRPQADLGFIVGVTGVDLFFIISGFVIFMSLNGIKKPIEFVINRFTRLFPTYWACAMLTFGLKFFFFNELAMSFKHFLVNLTMLQHFFRIEGVDGTYWTMIIELLFYFLMFFILVFDKLKSTVLICFFILMMIVFNDIILEKYFPFFKKIHFYMPLVSHFPMFFAGILFYKIIKIDAPNSRLIFVYYGLLIICFFVQLMLFYDGGRSNGFINFTTYLLMLFIYFFIFILLVNKKLKFLVNKSTLFLGKISFSLYLIHQFIGISMIDFFIDKKLFSFWTAFALALFVVVLLATLITFFIEIPVSKNWNARLKTFFIKQ